ncbi:hypothetical protein LCGC14_2296860 [marine sediment metagenome]|uniref:Uncharacterized protein n=1 Tax=marine sediment metagenome TaxID=412755 RepID=A0A0F9DC94_9ZZZZ
MNRKGIDLEKRHQNICNKLFDNLPRYIKMNRLAFDCNVHWTTMKTHLKMMSICYKKRNKSDLPKANKFKEKFR